MQYAVLALLAATPVVLLAIVRQSYLRCIASADLEGDEPEAAPALPDDLERRLTPIMAVLTIAFLVLLAVNIPTAGVSVPEDSAALLDDEDLEEQITFIFHHLGIFIVLWGLFVLEALVSLAVCGRGWNTPRKILAVIGALVPPLRLLPAHGTTPGLRYVPFVGWEQSGKLLLARLERAYSVPMMVVALLILPILAIEFLWKAPVVAGSALYFATDVGTRAIWLTFAVEFFVLVAAAPKKLAYCKSHWIDLAIILLPLISFLRSLRILRLGRLAKVQKMTRVYRLRGVALRLLRTVIVLRLADRMGGWASRKRLDVLRGKLRTMEEEMEEIRQEIAKLEAALEVCEPAVKLAEPERPAEL